MRAIELLRKDHRVLERLFSEYEALSRHSDEKKDLYEKIRLELELHSEIEEQIFFPAMLEAQPADAAFPVSQALVEGQNVKERLHEISTLDPVEDEFDDRMHELRQSVERHIREQEGEMFSDAGEALSGENLEELGQRMEELRSSLTKNSRYRKTA